MNHTQPGANLETVRRLYDLFNRRKWQELGALYTENTWFLDNKIGDRFVERTKENVVSRFAALERKYPGLKEQILYIEESGDQVFVQYVSSGNTRHGQHWREIAWTIFTLEDGKIAKVATYISQPE